MIEVGNRRVEAQIKKAVAEGAQPVGAAAGAVVKYAWYGNANPEDGAPKDGIAREWAQRVKRKAVAYCRQRMNRPGGRIRV